MKTINAKTLMAEFITIIIVTIVAMFSNMDVMLVLVIISWGSILIFDFVNIKNHIAFFCFFISFFVFLLGRQVIYTLFDRKEVYAFLDVTNNHTYFLLFVSIVGLCFGSWIASNNIRVGTFGRNKGSFLDRPNYGENYSNACRIMFYICYIFSIIFVVLQIVFVRRVGYLASYTTAAGGVGISSVVTYFSTFMPVVLSLYLATFPPKKKAIKELILYEIYGVLTVFTGQRYPFIGVSMYIFSYLIIRSRREAGWFRKRYLLYIAMVLPALVVILTAIDSIRLGQAFSFTNLGETIVTFFDQQGGSINTIRRTIYNANELKDMHLVSLGGTYSALFENFIARLLFGAQTYSGNTIERAMAGHDLSARLSLIAYGDGYLNGLGAGSSYIAELFHDFGAIGVLLGSIFYGFVLSKISRIEPGNKLWNGIGLAMMYFLYLSPRGGFDSFVGSIFRIYSIFLFFIIILLSWALKGFRHHETLETRI